MQTALVSTRRRAALNGRRGQILAAGAATLACAAAVIGFAVSDGDDPAKATQAPVIDARPLPPSPAAERFHHRLDELPAATTGEGRQR
jgi:hypothetical protein